MSNSSSSSSSKKPILGIKSTMNDEWQLNLRKLFERGIICQPKNELITKTSLGYHRMTYIELQQRATRMASALSSRLGIRPGDRVASLMWNNGRHMILYYAIPSMGAVLHTLNMRLHLSELAYIIQHAQDQVLFVDANLLSIVESLPSNVLQSIKKIIVCGPNEASGNWKSKLLNVMDFEELEAMGKNVFEWPELDDRTGCALCYTSGTTGEPKGVLYSHRSTFLHTLMMTGTDVWGLSGTDCVLPIVPMFHVCSWGTPFAAFTLGFKVLLYNDYRAPHEMLEMCADEKASLILGVPSVMQGIRHELHTSPDKYNQLKGCLTRIVCGGSAPPTDMIEWFYSAWGIELIQGWGMTEANPLGTVGRRYARRDDLNTLEKNENQDKAGILLPTLEAKLVSSDDMTTELPWDGVAQGELLIRGPWVTKEYFEMDTPEKFKDGWLVTGDVSSFTTRSQLIIRDRSKDMIKSGGEWISSKDMENLVMSLPAVDKACVIGVPHPKWDERPIVVAQLKPKQKLTYDEVISLLSKTYAKFQLPDDLLIWEEVPLGSTGKLDKKTIRKMLSDQKYVLPSLCDNAQSKL